jgi:predicted nicotinamide N-methyase
VGRRVLVAGALTALVASVAIAAGGAHVASTSISNLVNVAHTGNNGPNNSANSNGSAHQDRNENNGKDDNGNGDDNPPSSGEHQYAIALCHHTHSATNPWIELFLPPPAVAAHLAHHDGDYIVGAPGNPDTCPP